MAISLSYFLLFVFLVLHFNSLAAFEAYDTQKRHLPDVHVINALPENTDQISLTCLSSYTGDAFRDVIVRAGNDFRWRVGKNILHQCHAMWDLKFALWHAYQPKRDVNHGQVFWLVKENGFFLSWDNSTWVKKSTWETE